VPIQASRCAPVLFGPQRPGDVAAVADLVIRCHERDLALSLELAADLAVQASSGWPSPSAGSRPPAPGAAEKRLLGVQGIRLDQHALKIQLAEQLLEHGPLVVLAGGVAGLADRHAQGCRIQRHLGNERRAAAGGGLDRAPQRLAVTHQLVEIAAPPGIWAIVQSRIAAHSAATSTCRKK
jgi:hypothetical protein